MAHALHLTTSLSAGGFHPAGWRICRGDIWPPARRFQAMARIAERGLLDAIWLGCPADPLPLDPLPLLGSLIGVTERIGLGAALAVDHTEPFNAARVFATLDHLASGRVAWVTALDKNTWNAAYFGHAPALDAEAATARAAELVGLVRDLWDSWEDEGFLLEVPTGRFADPARVHPINHAGRFFTVRGPLNVPRPVQGNPPLVIALPAAAARKVAAAAADVLLLPGMPLEEAVALRRAMRAAAPGRAEPARMLVDIMPILASTEAEAQRRADDLDTLAPDTTRALRFAGTPNQLADVFARWVEAGACDGFNLLPADLPDDLEAIVQTVVPIARARGLLRHSYAGTTLREHLRLARPRSRFAA